MTVTDITNMTNQVQKSDFDHISKIMFDSFIVKKAKEDRNTLVEKEEMLTHFTFFLRKYLESKFLSSKKARLQFINFIDQLNLQKELLELQKGQTNIDDINLAAKTLGRKSQSAFKMK